MNALVLSCLNWKWRTAGRRSSWRTEPQLFIGACTARQTPYPTRRCRRLRRPSPPIHANLRPRRFSSLQPVVSSAKSRHWNDRRAQTRATMILPGETGAGSAGIQPCRGIAWWAHRNDIWQRRNLFLALLTNPHLIGRPSCLENPRPEGRNIH
jgi:hypothetical protein